MDPETELIWTHIEMRSGVIYCTFGFSLIALATEAWENGQSSTLIEYELIRFQISMETSPYIPRLVLSALCIFPR